MSIAKAYFTIKAIIVVAASAVIVNTAVSYTFASYRKETT
jgi:hypothetical protein